MITLLLVFVTGEDLHEFLGLNVPFFSRDSDLVYTGQEGGTAYLQCEIHNLNNKSVSWLRERDRHILTVDKETFISDRRFVSLHKKTQISDIFTLSLHHLETSDAGKYQCQVSSLNKISRSVELVVIKPQVKILGGQDIHVKEGSKVILKCVITNIVEKPPYVTWYLNNKMLVDFTGGLSSLSHAATHSISSLHLDSVQMADNGNYTCHPAGLHKVSISLHVLQAEKEQKLVVKESSASDATSCTSFNYFRLVSFWILALARQF